MKHLAVQLYTVREECEKDFLGTLEKVAALGYEGVEFAGFYNIPSKVLKEHLERLGLKVVASHTGMELLKQDIEGVIAYNKVIGNTKIVCPWAKVENKDDLEELIKDLGSVLNILEDNGMQLLYHNHDHEFKMIDNKYILDHIFDAFDGKLKAEIDSFWVYRAGADVTAYMESHKDILELVHLKDGTKEEILSVGSGNAPIQDIIKKAQELGAEWLVVENDTPSPDGISDITKSMEYLKKL